MCWDDVAWVRDLWGGKLILKGIMDPRDAKMAVDVGADAPDRLQSWRTSTRWGAGDH